MADFSVRLLHFRQDGFLDLPDFSFVPLVEGPLLDSLRAGQPSLAQNPHVFAGGRLTYAELARNQAAADPISSPNRRQLAEGNALSVS